MTPPTLDGIFRQHWTQLALVDLAAGHRWNFGQLYEAATNYLPMPPGQVVAFSAHNRLGTVLAYLAGWINGCTLVPLDADLPDPASYVELAQASCYLAELPLPPSPSAVSDCPSRPLFALADDACPVRFFTSGTTQTPKVVLHQLNRMLANVTAFQTTLSDANLPPSPMLHGMPLHYMAGVLNTLLAPWAHGQPVLLAPSFGVDVATRLDAWLRDNADLSPAQVWLSPTMLAMLTRLIKTPARRQGLAQRLSTVLVGTAPLPLPIQQAFESGFGLPCLTSYGLSELLLVSVNTTAQPGPVGKPLAGVRVQVDDQQQLWIASDYAMTGYLNTPSPTKAGWFPTGDMAALAEDNEITITGRLKDLIIRGGVNISPQAVEAVILAHPAVTGAAVYGQPDPFWGETVHAVVEVADMTDADLSSGLWQHCRDQLPTYAQPASLRLVDQLPRTSTGKIRKHLLV